MTKPLDVAEIVERIDRKINFIARSSERVKPTKYTYGYHSCLLARTDDLMELKEWIEKRMAE